MFTRLFRRSSLVSRRLAGRCSFRPMVEALEGRLTPATIHWNTNADGNFFDAANWNVDGTNPVQHRVPAAGDDAVIGYGSITVSAASGISVRSLDVSGTLDFTGGTITTSAGSYIHNLQLDGNCVLDVPDGVTLTLDGGTRLSGTTNLH